MDYRINIRNNWWFDAGIVGLYFIADNICAKGKDEDIGLNYDEDSLIISGHNENVIREFLEKCYKELADLYWNVSTKKQREKMELVMYDLEKDEFYLSPKRQATPVVSNFVKGTSWKANAIEYEELDDNLKIRTDEYIKNNNKSLWGNKKKLLLSLPESQPNIKILPEENIKRQSTCTICGKHTSNLVDISQPSFLLFASKSAAQSFHSQGRRPAKICWECEMISKFTMHAINYKQEGDKLSILLLNSPNLKLDIDNQMKIGCSSVIRSMDDEYFYRNIGFDEKGLTRYASLPYELLWAYFIDTYAILNDNIEIEIQADDAFGSMLEEVLYSPIEIIVLSLVDKGQTFITNELIFYNDVSYVYRVINELNKEVDNKKIFDDLLEKDSKGNKLPSRNKIFKNILNKHCILKELVSITEKKAFENSYINVSEVLKFLIKYYLIIKEDVMNKEQIDTAVSLGERIVYEAYDSVEEKKDILKKIKGDLYALRKTRTSTDFITQINTFQFRYGISVSKEMLQGAINEVPFEDFKGYCIMGALNKYNYFNYINNKNSKNKTNNKGEKVNE